MRWEDVIRVIASMPPHRDLAVLKGLVPHPSSCGFRRRLLAEPRGQRGDWELVVKDGRSVHVREYGQYYLVHWDRYSPSRSPLGHLTHDAPHWLAPILAGAAFAIALLLGLPARVGAAGALTVTSQLLSSLRWP
ncbi:MAG: hypothetical protein ACP5HK_06625 [Acidilobus sp.]